MNKFLDFINLSQGEEDKNEVLENVQSNVSFRGANLWILACAILIASVGLNVNSTAVIIGAMLISPLMGPIMGAGFALGIFDFDLLKKSLKNLLIATVVSLMVSTFYFYLSPFKETQSELLARTAPNIYDILIAFFGGLVGVIATTRKQKGNPIPGVAIATALMPPLCTAGYGLAVGNLKFFGGAIFLYLINCVFICVAAYLIVKFLKYPRIMTFSAKKEKLITYFITVLTLALFVPSVYFAYRLFEERKFGQKIDNFVLNEFTDKGYTVIYKKAAPGTKSAKLELAFLSKKFSREETSVLQERLKFYGLDHTRLVIRQDTTNLKQDILNQINSQQAVVDEKELTISKLHQQIREDLYDNASLLEEARIIYPQITDISISNHPFNVGTDKELKVPVAIYRSAKPLDKEEEKKLGDWIKVRIEKTEAFLFWKSI